MGGRRYTQNHGGTLAAAGLQATNGPLSCKRGPGVAFCPSASNVNTTHKTSEKLTLSSGYGDKGSWPGRELDQEWRRPLAPTGWGLSCGAWKGRADTETALCEAPSNTMINRTDMYSDPNLQAANTITSVACPVAQTMELSKEEKPREVRAIGFHPS